MTKKKLYITGCSGCVGHYVLEHLLNSGKDYEYHLMIRNPLRLHETFRNHPDFHFHHGEMDTVDDHKDVLKDTNILIHIATSWHNSETATRINRDKTNDMLSYCNPDKLEKVIYFSTASILGPGNNPIIEAEKYGLGYIRSKYRAHMSLKESKYADRIYTLFPTLVFGGKKDFPFSHISKGILENLKYLKWLRWLTADASCHFLHSEDIAKIVCYLIENGHDQKELVLGTAPVTADQLIQTLADTFGQKRRFKLPINPSGVLKIAKLMRIKIDPWTNYCIHHPHMVYDTVEPATFGLETSIPTFKDLMENLKTYQHLF